MMQSDRQKLVELFNKVKDLAISTNISETSELQDVLNQIQQVQNGIMFQSEYKGDYGYSTINTHVDLTGNVAPDTAYRNYLNSIMPSLQEVVTKITRRIDSFLESVRGVVSDDGATTMFQNLQSAVKLLAFFAIILYITLTGFQVVVGGVDLNFKTLTQNAYRLGLIYYFALGDAWKEYFYRMIFDASIGVSEILFDSTSNSSGVHSQDCIFTKAFYLQDQDKECLYPNPQLEDPLKPFKVADDPRNGQPIYGCLKGPFVFEPNYARLYNPSFYFTVDKNGQNIEHIVQMYCVNPSGQTVPANKIMNDVTNRPKAWSCNFGYKLEEGIRIAEYKKMGLGKIADYFPDKRDSDIIPTALVTLDENGFPKEIYPKRPRSVKEGREKIARFKEKDKLETLRANVNQSQRLYPKIQKFGASRDYSYVGLFDMMDCKITKYVMYSADGFKFVEVFDLFSFVFGGVMVLILMFLMLLYLLFVAGLAGKVVQSYLVGMIAITILIYFSPVIMPLMLFDATKGIGADWVKKITGYAAYPAILFTTLGMSLSIFDYIFYGSSEKFIEQQMFKEDGGVDGKHCWNDDPWAAPTACLIAKLPYMKKTIHILFLSFSVVDVGSEPFLALMVSLLRMLIMLSMLQKIVMQFENTMKELFDITADTSLEGSIFNDAGGLKDLVTSKTMEIASSIKEAASKSSRSKSAGSPNDSADSGEGENEEGDDEQDESESEEGEGDDEPESYTETTGTSTPATTAPRPAEASSATSGSPAPSPIESLNKITESSEGQKSSNKTEESKTGTEKDNATPGSEATQGVGRSASAGSATITSTKDSSSSAGANRADKTEGGSTTTQSASDTKDSSGSTSNGARGNGDVAQKIGTSNTSSGQREAQASTDGSINSRGSGSASATPSSEGGTSTATRTTTLENDNYASSKGLSGDAIAELNKKNFSAPPKGSGAKRKRPTTYPTPDYSNVKSKVDTSNKSYKPSIPRPKKVISQRADYSHVKSRLFDYEKKDK
jgi:type IV secretory pathway VirB6-like protein